MCGIAGIVNFDGAPVDRHAVEAMTSSLAHRGPDGSDIWLAGHVGFGHRRLAIRDLSDAGRQPMHDVTGTVTVTYNGEIYNDADVRRELESVRPVAFHSTCDAEIIAPSYLAWGAQALDRFEGMFAFGLWDAARETLVLARDPVGIKPLYFSWQGRSLRFASEIKALLALPDQARNLSADALHRFLAQGYAGPRRSLIEGIQPVPPGSVLTANREGWRIARYWRPVRKVAIRTLDAATDEFIPLWRKVVEDQLISDVPVGVLLSGGIDSALIAAALAGRKRVPAFTAKFRNADFDETGLAAIAAQYAGLAHQHVAIDDVSDLEARFISVVHHFDGQLADSSALAFYSLCREARRSIPVLLTGDGADEFFAGYETYRASRIARACAAVIPAGLAGAAARRLFATGRANEDRTGATEKLARLLAGIAHGNGNHHPQWRRYLYPEQLRSLYGSAMGELAQVDPLDEYAAAIRSAEGTLTDRCLIADQAYYLPGDMLIKSDAMSMAHSVEVRVPFLDRRIMEFANRLDIELLTPFKGPDKLFLRHVLAKLGLPRATTRARKRGFNVPVASYLRNGLAGLGERLLDRDADCLAPFLRPDGVRQLWRSHRDRRYNHGYALWTLLTLAVWRVAARV